MIKKEPHDYIIMHTNTIHMQSHDIVYTTFSVFIIRAVNSNGPCKDADLSNKNISYWLVILKSSLF